MAGSRLSKMRFRDAARSMRALLQNPDDTAQAFRVIEALSGANGEKTLARLKDTPTGRKLLDERPALLARLVDHAMLRALPSGTLGRAYLDFLSAEGITAEGLAAASVEARATNDPTMPADLSFLRDRMRDQHDLWHVVTGYKGDLLGEAALLAFSFAQTRNPGVGFIVAIALLRGREPSVRRFIAGGLVRGLKAAWLPAVEWEDWLALPLAEVRRRLNVGEPPEYAPVRTTQYFANREAA